MGSNAILLTLKWQKAPNLVLTKTLGPKITVFGPNSVGSSSNV